MTILLDVTLDSMFCIISLLRSSIFSPLTGVSTFSRLAALRVKDMFWCLVHRHVSLVISDVRSMCCGRILQDDSLIQLKMAYIRG